MKSKILKKNSMDDKSLELQIIQKIVDAKKRVEKKTDEKIAVMRKEIVEELGNKITKAISSKEVVDSVNGLEKKTSKLFSEQTEQLVRINSQLDDEPSGVFFNYNRDNRLSRVIYEYDGYSIIESWLWDSNGKLQSVKSTRVQNED